MNLFDQIGNNSKDSINNIFLTKFCISCLDLKFYFINIKRIKNHEQTIKKNIIGN